MSLSYGLQTHLYSHAEEVHFFFHSIRAVFMRWSQLFVGVQGTQGSHDTCGCAVAHVGFQRCRYCSIRESQSTKRPPGPSAAQIGVQTTLVGTHIFFAHQSAWWTNSKRPFGSFPAPPDGPEAAFPCRWRAGRACELLVALRQLRDVLVAVFSTRFSSFRDFFFAVRRSLDPPSPEGKSGTKTLFFGCFCLRSEQISLARNPTKKGRNGGLEKRK